MSHQVIIGGIVVRPPHPDDGRVAGFGGEIAFGDISFTPAHDMTPVQVANQVEKILKTLGKLGEVGE